MASVDFKEAYLHIPILPLHCCFLCFCVGYRHFQFWALPFGLSMAPKVFTKVLVNLVAHLQTRGIHIHPHLDNLLVRSQSRELCMQDVQDTLCCLRQHSFVVSIAKSPVSYTETGTPGHAVGHLTTLHVSYLRKSKKDGLTDGAGNQGQDLQSSHFGKMDGPPDIQYGCTSMGSFSHLPTPVLP